MPKSDKKTQTGLLPRLLARNKSVFMSSLFHRCVSFIDPGYFCYYVKERSRYKDHDPFTVGTDEFLGNPVYGD